MIYGIMVLGTSSQDFYGKSVNVYLREKSIFFIIYGPVMMARFLVYTVTPGFRLELKLMFMPMVANNVAYQPALQLP